MKIDINGQQYNFCEYIIPGKSYSSVLLTDQGPAGTATLSSAIDYSTKRIRKLFPSSTQPCFDFNRIFVPSGFRNQRFGSFILDKVVEWAKREKVFIVNDMNPYGDLNLEELTAFFVKHGFKVLGEETVYFSPINSD
jgi:hypothetical protein